MSKIEKIVLKFKSKPSDFTFDELIKLLRYYGYSLSNKGKTSGSRVIFTNPTHQDICIHRPHKRNYLLQYQINIIEKILNAEKLL